MDCVIFFDSQEVILAREENLGMHCSIIHMNLACHSQWHIDIPWN